MSLKTVGSLSLFPSRMRPIKIRLQRHHFRQFYSCKYCSDNSRRKDTFHLNLCVSVGFLQETVAVMSSSAPMDNVLTKIGGVMEPMTAQMTQMSVIVVSTISNFTFLFNLCCTFEILFPKLILPCPACDDESFSWW